MTKTYWTVVYKPERSSIWTLWYGEGDADGVPRWLGKRESAQEVVDELNTRGLLVEYINPNIMVPLQFRVAKVEVEE